MSLQDEMNQPRISKKEKDEATKKLQKEKVRLVFLFYLFLIGLSKLVC